MPDNEDPLAAYEAEVADIADPSGFQAQGDSENGDRIFELLGMATDLIVDDLVVCLNKGQAALCRYLLPTGISITAGATAPRTLHILVQVPGDFDPFIVVVPKDAM